MRWGQGWGFSPLSGQPGPGSAHPQGYTALPSLWAEVSFCQKKIPGCTVKKGRVTRRTHAAPRARVGGKINIVLPFVNLAELSKSLNLFQLL